MTRGITRTLSAFMMVLGALLATPLVTGQDDSSRALLLTIDDAIGPATSDYVVRGIAAAQDGEAALVILEMDTPGGLDSAMRDIIKAILGSDVPVVTYVSPSGSRAASAGTYIMYASHVAAMAPATNLGAATPVQIGGGQRPAESPAESPTRDEPGADKSDTDATTSDESSSDDGASGDDMTGESPPADDSGNTGSPAPTPGTATERKAINDAVAYIRGLAQMRGRNVEWAEDAVRSAVSLSAEQAVEQNVADLVATDLADLLDKLDGREVDVGNDTVTLATKGITIERVDPDWRTKLLSVITNPNLAYILMLIGIYGLLLEGYNPGAIVPGVVGAICLLLALYALQVLPVNYAGLGLIALGIILMAAEVFVPSFGALGLGGIVAFVFGSIILFDTDVPGFAVARSVIGSIAVVGGLIVMAIMWFAMRAFRRPVVSGVEQLVGSIAEAEEDFAGRGTVFVHGETWNARSGTPITKGQSVRVTHVDGLLLTVEPAVLIEE